MSCVPGWDDIDDKAADAIVDRADSRSGRSIN